MSSSERLVESPLLGARHGFSTRLGGVSVGRYESLNLGFRWGDEREAVEENRRRLARDGGVSPALLATERQVHGARWLLADGHPPATLADEEADALIATEPGRVVGVYTADCVPILFADGAGRVAAAHGGWRGTVAGIALRTLDGLVAAGAQRSAVRVACGPSIGPCCFEVGEEVATAFATIPGAVLRSPGRKPHVDLWAANRALLVEAGLGAEQIGGRPPCTMCDRRRFFSFRRDGAAIGQMLSFVVAGPAAASA